MPRELAVEYIDEKRCFVSGSSACRILKAEELITASAHALIKAADEFRDKTTWPNELWQTSPISRVSHWNAIGPRGNGERLGLVLSQQHRRRLQPILHRLEALHQDVSNTLELALETPGCGSAMVAQKPRLLSDNGSSYIAADLAEHLDTKGMDHVRGEPQNHQTQGKIERWNQTLKNRVLLQNYYLPGDLERQIGAFWDHYNRYRYHESLHNVTPADAYHGRGAKTLKMRGEIMKQTIRKRRLQHQSAVA